MSSWAQAMVAAKMAVSAPTTAMMVVAPPASDRRGLTRAMRYTPAVSIVAAWMSAETGVGPSMASGSQTYNGSCADLPAAPSRRSNTTAVAVAWPRAPAWAKTVTYCREPRLANSRNMATMNPKSPTRLVTNALLAAVAAGGRSNQNEMRKYEQAPTPSHPRKVSKKLSARTSTSIEKTNRFRQTKKAG